MMPPSDSDSDDESEDGVSGHTNGQSKNAGMMPPSDSDDESDDEVAPLPKGKPFFLFWGNQIRRYGKNGVRHMGEMGQSPNIFLFLKANRRQGTR